MERFNLLVPTYTPHQRKAFMDELKRSEACHGSSYSLVEAQPGVFQLSLLPTAPRTGEYPRVYMDLKDFGSLYTAPSNKLNEAVQIKFGVYQDLVGQLWIDGSWLKDYGDYKAYQRNSRVGAAQTAFPTAKIHASPYSVHGWKLVG
jgi:hypothetical protein